VRTVGTHNLEPVDVICGGFPCQDISYAGKGLGLSGERSGLWYEFARIVGEMGPRFVVVENVSALLSRGLGDVLGTLSDIGYNAQWRTVRASDVGAPHRRERLFIVAYRHCARSGAFAENVDIGGGAALSHTQTVYAINGAPDCSGHGTNEQSRGESLGALPGDGARNRCNKAKSRLGRVVDGIPGWLDRWPARPGEPQEPWEAPRTCESAVNRAARLKALGNAVVPQVAEVVGRWLLEIAEKQLENAPGKTGVPLKQNHDTVDKRREAGNHGT
jgi:DNA (cytosine-5)-methyltransferase 1